MFFLLLSLYPIPSLSLPSIPLDSIPLTCNQCPNTRSLSSLIWTCFVTVFTCTWVAMHPNIPAPSDSFWVMSRRRAGLMFLAIIAPELVLYWAMRQRSAAKRIGEKYHKYGWGITHGFWLQMGGFYLCKNIEEGDGGEDDPVDGARQGPENMDEDKEANATDKDDLELLEPPRKPPKYEFIQVLSPELFHQLLLTKRIQFPSTTLSDIEDKSKGDGLAKGLVVLQTTWFVVQCIARGVQKLPLSQLEIATVAFAALNVVVYRVWWDKPLDVGYGVGIVLENKKEEENKEVVDVTNGSIPNDPSENVSLHADPSKLTVIGQFRQYITDSVKTRGVLSTIMYILIYLPIRTLIMAPFGALTFEKHVPPSATRVPTFYAANFVEGSQTQVHILYLSFLIATIFGSIHLIAWRFAFASMAERWLWRSSALVVTCMPFAVVAFLLVLGTAEDWKHVEALGRYGAGSLFSIYSLARLILVVVVLIELRGLDSSDRIFLDVDWMKFIPHIG